MSVKNLELFCTPSVIPFETWLSKYNFFTESENGS